MYSSILVGSIIKTDNPQTTFIDVRVILMFKNLKHYLTSEF